MRLENLELCTEHMDVINQKLREIGNADVGRVASMTHGSVFTKYEKQVLEGVREANYEFHGIEWKLGTGLLNGKRIYWTGVDMPALKDAQSDKTERGEK
jgi:hypothetical protein